MDGSTIRVLLPSQDHKRHMDGDVGANTGGMGAYCPCPLITESELAVVRDKILQKAVDGLKVEGIPFIGKTLNLRRSALFTHLKSAFFFSLTAVRKIEKILIMFLLEDGSLLGCDSVSLGE